ncbi:hypothetical protein TMUPMC115_1735 [Tetragenococcus muriaticus PMC-11-5]|uniref:Phosphate transport system permease protein n=1 Tax=Tetragenococcus muriaticus PMC-11-5 TaxID=1302649 RepID=A0A091C257_9ENTE|nr:hypothetical protein TMUPMC115_1735 [Tetragenococcus muriaticus PMC-11-5]
MKAKRWDKIATTILYIIAAFLVLVLAFLLVYILARGIPHISWEVFNSASKVLPRRWWDWHSAI